MLLITLSAFMSDKTLLKMKKEITGINVITKREKMMHYIKYYKYVYTCIVYTIFLYT